MRTFRQPWEALLPHRSASAASSSEPPLSVGLACRFGRSDFGILCSRCRRPDGLRARGVIDRRQLLGRCGAEHDGIGIVEDLTEGDGGWGRAPGVEL